MLPLLLALFSQAAPPVFEVASVRLHEARGGTIRLETSGARLSAEAQTVSALIAYAWDLKGYQVPSTPALAPFGDLFYDIAARAAGDSNKAAGDSNKAAGDSNKAAGDSNKAAGDSNKAAGDSNKAAGDSNKAAGDSNKAAGDSNKAAGDSNKSRRRFQQKPQAIPTKAAGDSNKAAGDSNKAAGDSNKSRRRFQQKPQAIPTKAAGDSNKAAGGAAPPPDAFRLMLQALMVDRFQLRVHRETRELPVYELVVGKGGPKFRQSASDAPPIVRSPNGRNVEVTMPHANMDDLVRRIENSIVDRPVIDKTGLTGAWEIRMTYTPDYPTYRRSPDPDDIGIFTAVRALGLPLEPRRNMVEVLVVDHLETPRRQLTQTC